MKTLRVAVLLLLVAFTVGACSLVSPPPASPPPVSDPVLALLSADQGMKEQVRLAMQRAAEAASISIQLDKFVYVSRDDVVAAHALVTGFDSLRLQEPNRVGDLGFAFLSLPTPLGIPKGFYKIRVFVRETKAELINAQGNTVATLPLEQGHEQASVRPLLYITGCRVTLIYQQANPGGGIIPIQAAVPMDWCKPVGPTGER
jgi:hypothetical protein